MYGAAGPPRCLRISSGWAAKSHLSVRSRLRAGLHMGWPQPPALLPRLGTRKRGRRNGTTSLLFPAPSFTISLREDLIKSALTRHSDELHCRLHVLAASCWALTE